jgi:hypothetical protein
MKHKETKEAITSDIFLTHHRFLRSTNIETDWYDPLALEGYTFTPHAALALSRLSVGLKKSSTLRAWRITGDYGSGKSSFGLLLSNILAKRVNNIPASLRNEVKEDVPDLLKAGQPILFPIIVTGSRQPLGLSILNALLKVHEEQSTHRNFYGKLESLLSEPASITDEIVVEWVKKSQTYFIKQEKADGILLIVDEAGKFFEQAALHPERTDIFLLQSLAEVASRSGAHPFFVVTILHQGVSAYSMGLSKSQQREWEKIAGRFEEIIWHYPVEQSVLLAAKALNINKSGLNKSVLSQSRKDMQEALKIGWFGNGVDKGRLLSIAEGLYPVHPTVFPVLVKLFSSLGQNERTLYSFLLGFEPFGLQDFFAKTKGASLYQLANLYDYTKTTFGSKLGTFSYHWKAIDALISKYSGDDQQLVNMLKSIGILNLVNANDLLASNELLSLIFGSNASKQTTKLLKNQVIHYRGNAGGYCIWPNTSVNLSQCYKEAKSALGELKDIKFVVRQRVETRPIVARRHYIETGTLRFFEIRYVDTQDLEKSLSEKFTGDGLLLIPLCESLKDVADAVTYAAKKSMSEHDNVVVVVPAPLSELTSYIEELRIWEWIERSIGELRQDQYAREEVTRIINLNTLSLQQALHRAIGINSVSGEASAQWFYKGKKLHIVYGQDIMKLLADICDNCYDQAPRIYNELINRRQLSSAGALARLKLCENLFEYANQPLLGMNSEKRPPEMSMYLSVLLESGLHAFNDKANTWEVRLPTEVYDTSHSKILPVMNRIHEVLAAKPDTKLPVEELFEQLRAKPFGIRDGLSPLLLAVFAVIHEQEVAFYEDGSFIPRITYSSYLRLIKAPETFEVQYYPISGVRTSLFARLVKELALGNTKNNRVDILDVIRPLFAFVSSLPEFVAKTATLTERTQKVRALLVSSTDPVKLIFTDLPSVFGLTPISNSDTQDSADIKSFIDGLKDSLDEMRACYPNLLHNLETHIQKEFEISGSFEGMRAQLADRADTISGFVSEIQLKAFCARLSDRTLGDEQWAESMGGMVCSLSPKKWRDREVQKFGQDIHFLIRQFLRVESLLFDSQTMKKAQRSIRVAVTRPNGEERGTIIHLTTEEIERLTKLEAKIDNLLKDHGQIGIAAATEVLWRMMVVEEPTN